MAHSLAFGFLPNGGFVVVEPENMDASIPHHFIRVPEKPEHRVYRHVDYSPVAIARSLLKKSHDIPKSRVADKTTAVAAPKVKTIIISWAAPA